MDKTALFSLTYGVYVVSTMDSDRMVGCVANSVMQISSSPATLAVSINKDNHTHDCILKTGAFTVSILSERADGGLIGTFGFHSSRETDKFENAAHRVVGGLPILTDGVCAWLSCKVIGSVDAGTHTVILAELTDAAKLNDEPPMTYAYYHKVIKGKAPKNAPTYVEEEQTAAKAYVCTICGYVYPGSPAEFEALPDDWLCPLCGAPKAMFELK